MLDALQSVLLHISGNLRREDQAWLLWAFNSALDGIGAELVGGPALVNAVILGEAVQNVKDDNAKVVEGSETVASWKRLAVLEPFNLGEIKISF